MKEVKEMNKREVLREIKNINNHIENCSYGKFELYYREELFKRLEDLQK